MAVLLSFDFWRSSGELVAGSVSWSQFQLTLTFRSIVALRASALTHLTALDLSNNALTRMPDDVWLLTRLERLSASHNALLSLSPQIAALRQITRLALRHNRLRSLPAELFTLTALTHLVLDHNELCSIAPAVTQLASLARLDLRANRIAWLPDELADWLFVGHLSLSGNPIGGDAADDEDFSCRLGELALQCDHVGKLREQATTIAIGLAELDLPVLVTLEIVDAARPNSARMAAKWAVLAKVKHWLARPPPTSINAP